jgi:hypothetical protein
MIAIGQLRTAQKGRERKAQGHFVSFYTLDLVPAEFALYIRG